jgi:hypothetical protein
VNGYVFMITNNGHVVIHPDWRPEVTVHSQSLYYNINVAITLAKHSSINFVAPIVCSVVLKM